MNNAVIMAKQNIHKDDILLIQNSVYPIFRYYQYKNDFNHKAFNSHGEWGYSPLDDITTFQANITQADGAKIFVIMENNPTQIKEIVNNFNASYTEFKGVALLEVLQ